MRENRKERFGIRKYSIGVTSALLGVLLFLGTNNEAQAAENSQTSTELAKVTDQHQQAAEMGAQAKSEETTANQPQDITSGVTSSSDTVKKEVSTQSTDSSQDSTKEVVSTKAPIVSKSTEKNSDATSKDTSKELNAVDTTPVSINQTGDDTKETNNVYTNPPSETKAVTPDVAPTTLNVSDSNYQNNPSSTPTPVDAPLAVTNENIINPTNRNEEEPIEEVKFGVRSIADDEVSVSSWAELVKAVNNLTVKKVVATSNLTATSNLDIPVNRNVEIEGSTLNLGDYQIVPNAQSTTKFSNLTLTGNNKKGIIASQNVATVELNNVKHTGADLVNAKALNVIVSGHTASTVTTANNRIALNSEANIYSANLEIAKDSTLTIKRNDGLQGDLVHLSDNGKVELKDNATFNATLNGQRRDAAVRVSNNGHFVTGAHSNVNLTTHNSRGIVLGQRLTGELPAGSEASYAKSDLSSNQANDLIVGRYTTMNFSGREAVLMGHNSTFKSGESSNITFNNNGDGVAFDMGDEARFTVEPHAVMHLNSTGKKHSGNWQYSNYIGLDNNGKIRIEHDSEVYVNLTDRGTHPYNDTININSTKPGSQPYFYVGDNAILDVQDSSPDYYAELISVPLPGSSGGTFEFDQVKYLNLQKHTDIIGHLGNGNLIFMDTKDGKFIAHGPFVAKQWDNKVHDETPSNIWQPVEDINIPWRNFNPTGKIEGTLYGNTEEPISDHDKKFSDKFNPQKSQRIVLQGIKIPAEHVNRKVEPIPFEIEKIFNPLLKPNEEIIIQQGVLGEKEIIKKSYTLDGKPDPNKPDVTEENITKTPIKQIIEYGPVYGEPIVEKTPIPFEKERVFDVSLPVSSPDKLITAGENGEKTKTTPVLIDSITHQKVGEDTPVEEVTKQPVNEVVHFAPVAVPHKDTEVFDPSVPVDQKEVTPGEDGLKNPETNEIVKQPKDGVTKYGPKTGTPEVVKAPIPFETERVFDVNMPVGTPDKTVTEGENGEKTITTPVTVNPLTGEELSKGTPVEEVTKQPVNKVVHFAPVAVPHKDTEVFDPSVPVDQKEVTPGEDGLKNPATDEIVKQPKDGVTKYGPKTGTPEVVKAPIPFETERVFDVNMPVGTPDKTVTEGENGEKTITTPVTVNPLTGEELSKGTPVEEVTKQPVNKVVHFAPVAVPHKDTEVFDPSVPVDQKEVTPGEDGLKNPATDEIVKQPKDGVTKYGPKTGTPEVVKAPIPFETERVFDVNMPVGTPDKTVTEGENGEKTITTPVTVNPLTGEELSKGRPVEEVTKQPVNEVVHVAPKVLPHKTVDIFDPTLPAGETVKTPGEDGIVNPLNGDVIKEPKDEIVRHGTQPQNGTYEPEVKNITKPFGEPTTADEVQNNVKVPGFPTEGDQPKVTLDDPTQLPDGNTSGTTPVDVTVT
ncbi:YSIRK-type signal peptide-containing protein, partial [Staphylococcus simulans]|uniref:G5 domain-containing protein n=1 Tax=Staphylococcus simulans TaxID=1286 RepID=UPI000E69457B